MRSDDWLGAMLLCHLQMLHGQMVMRCLSRVWDVLGLSFDLDNAPLWVFPVMISPDTNTHFVLCTRVWMESEAALSDWFVFTSGSTLSDEELMAYTCTAVFLKHFAYEKCALKSVCKVRQVFACACVLSNICNVCAHLGMSMNTLVYLCIHCLSDRKCIDGSKERNVLHCTLVVLRVLLTVYMQQGSLSMRLYPLPVYSSLHTHNTFCNLQSHTQIHFKQLD